VNKKYWWLHRGKSAPPLPGVADGIKLAFESGLSVMPKQNVEA